MSTNHKSTGQSNKRKHPSSPRTNDRHSSHITNSRPSHSHHHHQNRNRPRSGSSSLPTTSQDQQHQSRRPSAPPTSSGYAKQPLLSSDPPRLSIADRFMSPNFSLSQTTSPALSTSTSTALSNSALSHSGLSDIQTTITTTSSNNNNNNNSISSNSRLSVADRFMNSPISSSSLTISTTTGRGKTIDYRHSSPMDSPVPGKLSIASTFMRHTSDASFLSPRSRAHSVGEMDLGLKNKYSKITPSSSSTSTATAGASVNRLHPLDMTQKSTLFFDSDQLNLDLSLPTTFENQRRQFGSQDTLVQTEKKRPIYAQFIESEKNATLHDDENRYSYSTNHVDHERRDTAVTIVGSDHHHGHLSEKWQYDDDDYDEENEVQSYSSTPPRRPHTEEHHETSVNGFWIGCCFITCGQRPSQSIIGQKEKKRLEGGEKEYDQGNSGKKGGRRSCGRRGWVICIFLGLILIVLVIYFLWPRTPLMRIEGAKLVTAPKITQTRQGAMMSNVAFESQWLVNVTVDNRQNHVPTRLTKIQVLAKDALTGLVIGKGLHNDNPEQFILSPNAISTIQLPIHVDYQARDSTDTTFVDLTKSCSPPPQNSSLSTQREALPLHFWITLHFFGLDWLGYKPTVIATPATGGFACPVS